MQVHRAAFMCKHAEFQRSLFFYRFLHAFALDEHTEVSFQNMPKKHSTTISDQAEREILKFLLSKDKDKSLNFFKDRIKFDQLDPKGNKLTEKKLRSRLTYLKKLEKENRKEFLEICVQNHIQVDWEEELQKQGQFSDDSDEENFDPEQETTAEPASKVPSSTPSRPSTPSKRTHDEMTAAIKKVKLEDDDICRHLGLPIDSTNVIHYEGKMLSTPSASVLHASNDLPGVKGLNGEALFYSGFVISALVQTTEVFENEEDDILHANVVDGRFVVITTVRETCLHLNIVSARF